MTFNYHFKKLFHFLASLFSAKQYQVLLCFLILGVVSSLFLDYPVLIFVDTYMYSYRFLFKILSLLIFPPFYLALSVLTFLLVRLTRYKKSLTLPLFLVTFAQCLSTATVRIFKVIIGKARPDIFLSHQLQGFERMSFNHHFHSFPSGHIMAAFTLATSLSLLYPHFRKIFFLIASFLSLSRVFLNDHYLSDLFGTAAIGMAISWISHATVQTIAQLESPRKNL